jgi:hypothetical protein
MGMVFESEFNSFLTVGRFRADFVVFFGLKGELLEKLRAAPRLHSS